MEKVIKRGYVKWTDAEGVFHKEPAHLHPEILANASVEEQIAAEEARRLNEAAAAEQLAVEDTSEQDAWDVLHALQGAPEEVLLASQLDDGDRIAADEITAAEIPVGLNDHNNDGNQD